MKKLWRYIKERLSLIFSDVDSILDAVGSLADEAETAVDIVEIIKRIMGGAQVLPLGPEYRAYFFAIRAALDLIGKELEEATDVAYCIQSKSSTEDKMDCISGQLLIIAEKIGKRSRNNYLKDIATEIVQHKKRTTPNLANLAVELAYSLKPKS